MERKGGDSVGKQSKNIALGGVMAALAVVIMCLGGMIPLATFICPALCLLMVKLIHGMTNVRIAWAWYGAVALLSVLMSPDKEAAAVFVCLGYYPIIKPKMDKWPAKWLWKLLFFNVVILAMYGVLIYVIGMPELAEEYQDAGLIMTIVTLLLGNVTFVMLDILLGRRLKIR